MIVEFFGVARLRAGMEKVELQGARSLADALKALEDHVPALVPTVIEHGRLQPFYALAVNGTIVPKASEWALSPGDALMILSADAGG